MELIILAVIAVIFFIGGVIFGRKHQAKIQDALVLSKNLQKRMKQ